MLRGCGDVELDELDARVCDYCGVDDDFDTSCFGVLI
jgi:hypothetical protein